MNRNKVIEISVSKSIEKKHVWKKKLHDSETEANFTSFLK